ncbi:TonB-dependent receptor [Sphingobacterium sp. WM]|uniref:SusC/RagA family TonB-linked outer membrane protein n=1 Tax=Sphingobacterium sp. WM TaxID=3031802 RepID=UPI00240D75EC|nr:TonB-dependent receptor [Sphingobacterium sp. WM]WFB62817.1 TonB-dependent receptor [Sphingobacterium sp. WM]
MKGTAFRKRSFIRSLGILLFLFIQGNQLYAQTSIQIEGTIRDTETKEVLVGVTIRFLNSNIATSTDDQGKFSIEVPKAGTLTFSLLGYQNQRVAVDESKSIDVELLKQGEAIDEVVVVAYGQQKKLSVTGAVSSVSSEELKKTPSASLAVALAGRLPGLSAMQRGGGQPGRDDATMFLRGAATTNGQTPLILIDGVPRDNIRTLDANEVETVTVLKDASATAVFGVRGANGVVLITTKRGKIGKMDLNASLDQSWTSFTREPERLTSLEYLNLRNQASINDGLEPAFTQEIIDRYSNPLAGLDRNDPDYEQKALVLNYMYPDHDYYREFISKNTPQTRLNINGSGGTEKVNYFVNGAFLRQGGNLNTEPKDQLGYDPSSWLRRYNFRSNLDYNISQYVKSFLNIGTYIEQVNMPSAGLYGGDTNWMMRDLIYQAQSILPITPGPVTIDGFGVAPGQIVDPGYMDRSAFEIMNRMGYRNEVRSNLNSSLGIDISLDKFVKGLSVKGMVSYDTKATTAAQGYKRERLYLAEIVPESNSMTYAVKRSEEELLSLAKGADSRYNINLQGTINYNRTFSEKHDVGAMILAQRDYWETTAGDFPFNVIGVAGRFTYGYDNRYLAEVNMGYNGSEQFSPTKRFGFFPAFSVGWIVSNESFMPKTDWLNNLKLRASYGEVGNDQMGGTRFLYQTKNYLGAGPLGSLATIPGSNSTAGQGIIQGLIGNPYVTWELAKKQNYGVDLSLFNDLNVAFDYYIEDRSQILIQRQSVPSFQGVPLGNIPRVNMGIVNNKGFEVELSYKKTLTDKLHLTFNGNYGENKNMVKFMDEPIRDESYIHRYRQTGFPLGQSFGYKIDYSNGNGMFNSQQELDDYLATTSYGFGVPRVGYFKYTDLNEDGVVDDKDQVPLHASSIPGITYGFGLTVSYAGFDASVFFQGVGRYASPWGGTQGVYENTYRGTYFGYHKTAWTAERFANGEEITYPALSTQSNTNHVNNDFFIMNRSYLRLRNIELAYTLPARLLQPIGVNAFRVYVSGHNLFLWDKLPMDHLDPENVDPIGYPVTKMLNMGVNVSF